MPKIKGTKWYTAAGVFVHHIEGSERFLTERWFGYRQSLAGLTEQEIQQQKEALIKSGILVKDRITQNPHTDIPAGTRIFEVSDAKSIANLEKVLAKKSIDLPANRFDIYKKVQLLKKQGGR